MNQAVLLPVFILVALLFALGLWLGVARYRAVSGRAVRAKDIALGQSAWPASVTLIDRAFHNQLEMPVVFYALVALVLATGVATRAFVWMEWLFVGFRLAHAYVHLTSNALRARFGLFLGGTLSLIAMWVWFAVRVLH